jgi:cell division protein FtsB
VVLFFSERVMGATVFMRNRNYLKTELTSRSALWKKLLITAGIFLSLYLLTSLSLGEMGLVKYYRMKAQYNALNEEIANLKRDNVKLSKDVYLLKSDYAYLERVARDKLGLARPGEIVYYYNEQ